MKRLRLYRDTEQKTDDGKQSVIGFLLCDPCAARLPGHYRKSSSRLLTCPVSSVTAAFT